MKKQGPRWYLLWFAAAGIWLITFCVNFFSHNSFGGLALLQLLTAGLSLAAGIVNARRCKQGNGSEKDR
jgi:hypothetical protein